jgi:integrase
LFSVEALNKWFGHATKEARPDDYWLPLLGTLTGARIGELAYLQGGDIQEVRPGLWVANLMTSLKIDDKEETRKLKNETSRRLFALHQELVEVGFVAYAKARRDSEWVFPHLHRGIVDPADTASKRQGGRLRAYGLHTRLETVFHSSRHSAKDILRIAKVDPRTSSMQTGHAFKTVEETYGSKTLRADEVEVLAAMPLPEGLDLSPYRDTLGPKQTLRRKRIPAFLRARGASA